MSSSDGAVLVNYLGGSPSATATITTATTANVTGSIYYNQNNLASFSSRGPAFDGRIKPEVVVRVLQTLCVRGYIIYLVIL